MAQPLAVDGAMKSLDRPFGRARSDFSVPSTNTVRLTWDHRRMCPRRRAVFTGRFASRLVEVLFDRICRENGITHRLTAPPTTTGKIERFHRSLRVEFLAGRVFDDLASAQANLDGWVVDYNTNRPHRGISMATPADRFLIARTRPAPDLDPHLVALHPDEWITRKVSVNGVITVVWQQISVGRHRERHRVDVHVLPEILEDWDGNELIKTVKRTSNGVVRKKKAQSD